jgi:hypothetical protein
MLARCTVTIYYSPPAKRFAPLLTIPVNALVTPAQ